ncbi:hypothetical protein HZA75_03375 [Candidatus Roizmanbacteria bacterium]|nr:hypothetical protein [Candidatus Roizmanbacteria bacterium]
MRNKKTTEKNGINKILKEIVITKKEGAKGDALKTLLMMRYGKEWKSAYLH